MVYRRIGGADFAMKSKVAYRGVEFAIRECGERRWEWTYFPKKEQGSKAAGEITGAYEEALKACEAAIDKFLAMTSN